MRVVHETADGDRTLASDAETADGIVSQGLGLMFRRSIPEDYALVFPFSAASKRGLHMVFVPFDIDALWLVDGEVRARSGCRRGPATAAPRPTPWSNSRRGRRPGSRSAIVSRSKAAMVPTEPIVTTGTTYTPIGLLSCDRVCSDVQWLL